MAHKLVSAKEMLEKARDGKYAVGQFNKVHFTDRGRASLPRYPRRFRRRRQIYDRL